MIRVMAVDDNQGMRLLIRKMVEKLEGFSLDFEACNGQDALDQMERGARPDVVFMDVEMPGEIDGVECARRIQDLDPTIIILFATAYEGYRREAFELYAFDYLVKPFSVERVHETLNRIRLIREPRHNPLPVEPKAMEHAAVDKLLIRQKESINLIEAKEILLIQREERATVIYTATERMVTGETLSELMERLPQDIFMRSHKSYIINLNSVRQIFPYGRWTYLVKLKNTDKDALMTRDKLEELQNKFA